LLKTNIYNVDFYFKQNPENLKDILLVKNSLGQKTNFDSFFDTYKNQKDFQGNLTILKDLDEYFNLPRPKDLKFDLDVVIIKLPPDDQIPEKAFELFIHRTVVKFIDIFDEIEKIKD